MIDARAAVEAITRRPLLAAGALVALVAIVWLAFFRGGGASGPVGLPGESALPDIVIGNPAARVTIVEYASMGCGHCAAFHNETLPKLKARYIDPGSARLVFREFPIGAPAMAVSMMARCAGGEKAAEVIADMFRRHDEWARLAGAPLIEKLREMARQHGFTDATLNACFSDTKLRGQIEAGLKRASETYGVDATPTFFVNGRRLPDHDMADFERAIQPLLGR